MSVLINCHIPKTGGTSMASLLGLAYGARHIDLYYPPPCPPLDQKYYPDLRRYWGVAKSLSSHQLRYCPPDWFWPGARFIVFFRDPVERVVSLYRHWTRGAPHLKYANEKPDYLESLEKFVSQLAHQNDQTRFLVGCGQDVVMAERHLAEALDQLKRYDYIGLTECYDESLSLIIPDYPELSDKQAHENRNPERGAALYRHSLMPEMVSMIEQQNCFDVILYQQARQVFELRLERAASVD